MNEGTEIRYYIMLWKLLCRITYSEVGVVVTDSFVEDAKGRLAEALDCLLRQRGSNTNPLKLRLSPRQIALKSNVPLRRKKRAGLECLWRWRLCVMRKELLYVWDAPFSWCYVVRVRTERDVSVWFLLLSCLVHVSIPRPRWGPDNGRCHPLQRFNFLICSVTSTGMLWLLLCYTQLCCVFLSLQHLTSKRTESCVLVERGLLTS